MTSRERVIAAINHQQPDRIPVDFGSATVSGINISVMDDLRRYLKLPEKTARLFCPFQMLAYVDENVRKMLGVDIIGVFNPYNKFGLKNDEFKPFKLFNGKTVEISKGFAYTTDEQGNLYAYPQGDTSVPPSAKMPKNGCYFDNLVRNDDYDEDTSVGREDFKNTFSVFSEEVMRDMERQVEDYYNNTDYAITIQFGQGSLGEPSILPGPSEKHPHGLRDFSEWLMAMYTNREYILDVCGYQTEIAMKNLVQYKEAFGDKINIIQLSATDFGTQNGLFISPQMYRELYMPCLKQMTEWIHKNTSWKVFFHTCGSVVDLMEDLIETGCDIVNPVQCSAKGMDPQMLKDRFGDRIVFHGGGVNTQETLPFGTPEEVEAEVHKRLEIFGKNGGYIFNTIHNIQYGTPVENIVRMFDTVRRFNDTHRW